MKQILRFKRYSNTRKKRVYIEIGTVPIRSTGAFPLLEQNDKRRIRRISCKIEGN
jgi:hypothetical protein